jgi:hypothetical protein
LSNIEQFDDYLPVEVKANEDAGIAPRLLDRKAKLQ